MLPFVVSLRFIVLIWTGLQSYEALITCEAGTFEAGKPAFVTCNFRTNITGSRRSLNMARYPKDAPKDAIGTDILLCRWSQEKNDHLCFLEGGNFAFDNILTDRLTVKIPTVNLDQEGLYMCFFVPPEGTDSHTCELTVVPAKSGGTDAHNDETDKTEESHDLLPIVLPAVIVPLVVIGIVGLVFFLCRRRLRSWHRRSRGEPTEKRATLREPGRTRSANKTMDISDHPSPSSPQEDTTYYEISDTANTHEMREVQNNYDVLNPYSNDDADRQPYSQLTSHAADVTKSSGNTAYANTACL